MRNCGTRAIDNTGCRVAMGRRWGWWRGSGGGRRQQRWRRWSRSADGRTWQVTWSCSSACDRSHATSYSIASRHLPDQLIAKTRTSRTGEIAATCSALECDVDDASDGKRVTRLTADLAALADSSPTSPPLSTNDPFDSFRQRAWSPTLRFDPNRDPDVYACSTSLCRRRRGAN